METTLFSGLRAGALLRFFGLTLAIGSTALAGRPAIQEVDDIDTAFGEDESAEPAPAPGARNLSANSTAATATDSDADDLDAAPLAEEDEGFDNVLDPGDIYERKWSLTVQYGLGGPAWDSTTGTVWTGITRSFSTESFSFDPRAGWYRSSSDPGSDVSHSGVFGAYASWTPLESHSIGLDGEWTTQEGPDDWTATADWSSDFDITEAASISVAADGGWSGLSRGFCGASLGTNLTPGDWSFDLVGSWGRRLQPYVNANGAAKETYVDAWGWNSSITWKSGSWTFGPSWSGEYWEVDATAKAKTSTQTSQGSRKGKYSRTTTITIPASGVNIDQTFAFATAWKPIESIRLKLEVSRSYGISDVSTQSGNGTLAQRKKATARLEQATLPSDSWGGTLGLTFDW